MRTMNRFSLLEFIIFCISISIRNCIFLLLIPYLFKDTEAEQKCQVRHYYGKEENIVCVCNATYCDEAPSVGKLQSLQAAIFTSSQSGKRFKRTVASFTELSNATDVIRLKINAQVHYQTVIGFGGAFTDAAVLNIDTLSQPTRTYLLESYFGNSGIQYTVGRVPIASCDFSTREYSYDDSLNDFALSNFSLAKEDLRFKIPYIKQAVHLTNGQLRLFASPWSAPGWMKTTGRMIGGGTLRGPPDGPYYKTWAQYYVKFLEAYKNNGVTFWGLTVQNEPVSGVDLSYKWQAMYFSPKTERDFIRNHLGPALRKSESGHNISLMIMDDQRTQLPIWADVVLKNKEVAQYVAGIAVHWYADFVSASQLSETHNRHPDKFILGTEASTGFRPLEHRPILGDWSRGDSYAHDIIEDLSNWVAGWTDWNLCLDLRGGPNLAKNYLDAPIIVNATADEFYKQPMFYALGHFSKFIRPGSIRIGLQLYAKPVSYELVAFASPTHQRILVLLNRGTKWITFGVADDTKAGKILQISMEPRSIATVIWNE